jgi:hypothetical protein
MISTQKHIPNSERGGLGCSQVSALSVRPLTEALRIMKYPGIIDYEVVNPELEMYPSPKDWNGMKLRMRPVR